MALSKDNVSKVVQQRKEKEKPDPRNLHLAREGRESQPPSGVPLLPSY